MARATAAPGRGATAGRRPLPGPGGPRRPGGPGRAARAAAVRPVTAAVLAPDLTGGRPAPPARPPAGPPTRLPPARAARAGTRGRAGTPGPAAGSAARSRPPAGRAA